MCLAPFCKYCLHVVCMAEFYYFYWLTLLFVFNPQQGPTTLPSLLSPPLSKRPPSSWTLPLSSSSSRLHHLLSPPNTSPPNGNVNRWVQRRLQQSDFELGRAGVEATSHSGPPVWVMSPDLLWPARAKCLTSSKSKHKKDTGLKTGVTSANVINMQKLHF